MTKNFPEVDFAIITSEKVCLFVCWLVDRLFWLIDLVKFVLEIEKDFFFVPELMKV